MRDRSLRVGLAFFLLFVLPVAPALQASPLERVAAAASLDTPFDLFTGFFDRLASWLGLDDEPEPRPVLAPDGTDDPPVGTQGDDGTCLNPDGHRVPCTP